VSCRGCGFVYADTNATQISYDSYYSSLSKYEDRKTGSGSGENPLDRKRLKDTAQQIASYLRNPKARILDVGCANGGLLRALQDANHDNLCGIDPSPRCVKNTRKLGIAACLASDSPPPFHPYRADFIILSHVLEHVRDLNETIQRIDRMLAENGTIYIEVPNALGFVKYLYSPFQEFNIEHINHFSLASLQRLMSRIRYGLVSGGEKLLTISKNTKYPVIFGFWKRSKANSITPETPKNNELKTSLLQYIQSSQALLNQIDARLQKLLPQRSPVVVWGTGSLTFKLLTGTSLREARIAAFVDSNPINQGQILRGIPIVPPKAVQKFKEPILVATILHQREISEQIHR
jgi:2-polyprenyl-3-methyl-5-hydroxy-6-metoxy-1,4-benzoquinol methylase